MLDSMCGQGKGAVSYTIPLGSHGTPTSRMAEDYEDKLQIFPEEFSPPVLEDSLPVLLPPRERLQVPH